MSSRITPRLSKEDHANSIMKLSDHSPGGDDDSDDNQADEGDLTKDILRASYEGFRDHVLRLNPNIDPRTGIAGQQDCPSSEFPFREIPEQIVRASPLHCDEYFLYC
jgi:hypothetical protein